MSCMIVASRLLGMRAVYCGRAGNTYFNAIYDPSIIHAWGPGGVCGSAARDHFGGDTEGRQQSLLGYYSRAQRAHHPPHPTAPRCN
jgi:hypothetical protein